MEDTTKKMMFWGYRHVSGSIQVKRYFIPLDIQMAEESDFCEEVYLPFEADNREEALAHIKGIIRDQKDAVKAKDESKKKLQEIKDKEVLRSVYEAGQNNTCPFDEWYNENH